MELQKLVDGVWCRWGVYDDPDKLARAAFELGRQAEFVENVRVVKPVGENKEVVLDGQMTIGGTR